MHDKQQQQQQHEFVCALLRTANSIQNTYEKRLLNGKWQWRKRNMNVAVHDLDHSAWLNPSMSINDSVIFFFRFFFLKFLLWLFSGRSRYIASLVVPSRKDHIPWWFCQKVQFHIWIDDTKFFSSLHSFALINYLGTFNKE